MRPPATKGNKKKDKLGDKLGNKGDKTSGRRTHHPTRAHMWRDNGKQDRGKVDTPSKAEAPSNTGTHVGKEWETIGDNGKQLETTGDKDRQEGGQWETRGYKTSGKRTRHPTQAHMWGDNGRQGRDQRRQTYHHRLTCGETMGNKKGTQDVGKADRGTRVWRQWETMGDNGRQWETMGDNGRQLVQWETRGDKGRQDLGKADTPSNTGRQGETRPREGEHIIQNMQAHMWGDNWRQKGKTRRREGGHTIQHRHTRGETMGNIGRQGIDKTSRRQTHHPTQAHMWGDNGGQVETGAGRRTHQPTKRKQEGRHGETKGDKTKAGTLRMR